MASSSGRYFAVGLGLLLFVLDRSPIGADDRKPTRETQALVTPHGTDEIAFRMTRIEKPTAQGGLEVDIRFLDEKGEVAMIEHAVLGPQAEVLEYTFEQRQVGDRGSAKRIQLAPGKDELRLSYTPKGKPTSVSQDAAPPNLVVGPSLVPYILKHREDLINGKELLVRVIVIDRKDTYGFSLRHRGRADFQGHEVARIEMRPTSFIIRQVLDPVSFFVDLDVRALLAYSGRVGVFTRKSETSSWDTIQALTVYKPRLGDESLIQAQSPPAP